MDNLSFGGFNKKFEPGETSEGMDPTSDKEERMNMCGIRCVPIHFTQEPIIRCLPV